MTEPEAVKRIEAECRGRDFDQNGDRLDNIVAEFLRASGHTALAAAVTETKAWRA